MHGEGGRGSLNDQEDSCRLLTAGAPALSPARPDFQRAARQLAECRVQSNRRETAQLFPTFSGRRHNRSRLVAALLGLNKV
jgi:hypothetical protein